MRVTLDISALFHTTTSGTATYLLQLTRHLPAAAPTDTFTSFYYAPWRSDRRRAPFGLPARTPPVPPRILQWTWRTLGFPSIEVIGGRPDVYHAGHIWQPPLRRARAVITVHDMTPITMPEVHPPGQVDAHRRLLDYARKYAAAVIVDSEATRRDVLAIAPDLGERSTVVYLAAADEFRPVDDAPELGRALTRMGLGDDPYFLFTGALEPRKNLRRLLESYRSLCSDTPDAPKLVINGPSGWGNETPQSLVEPLGLKDRVAFLGPVSQQQIRYLMSGALAFVYPSLYEGFGLPPLEAMACGAPVITSNVSSLPEVVGQAAMLVDPYSSDEIAGAMLRMWRDPGLRTSLRCLGLERARRFSWHATAQSTLAVYRSIRPGH